MVNFLRYIKKNFFKLLNYLLNIKSAFYHSQIIYTKNKSSGLKVHLGSGEINLQGWVNVDARDFSHIHLKSKDLKLKEFSDSSIDEIYLCHVLEHIEFKRIYNTISIFQKKLTKGGVLRISVPSFDSIIKIYKNNGENLNQVKYALMGGQDYKYNFHYSIYNENLLKKIFLDNGFKDILKWNTKEDFGLDIGDWSSAKFKTKKGIYDISLNLKGTKI